MFCPLFKEIKDRLLKVLDPRFKIFTDVSPDEFSESINRLFPNGLEGYISYENDISKYDKSQEFLALNWDLQMMRMFGITEEIIEIWATCHTRTVLFNRESGLKAYVNFQRKSGDAMTFFGNTLLLMAVTAFLIDVDNVVLGIFGGDDSSLIMKREHVQDRTAEFSNIFNFECKLQVRNYIYFCSKFLVYSGNSWFFVPDILKLVSKLGRKDLVNWDHCKDYFTSYGDLIKPLNNSLMMSVLNDAINERYVNDILDHYNTMNHLIKISKDYEDFKNLWYIDPDDILISDPKRPSLDI